MSDKGEKKPDGEGARAEVFTTPNLLKIRASAPGGKTLDEMVVAGTAVIASAAKNYADVANADVDEIAGIAAAMRQTPAKADEFRPELMRVGLNLKGQAATMGYPLVTEVAHSLIDFLDYKIASKGDPTQNERSSLIIREKSFLGWGQFSRET